MKMLHTIFHRSISNVQSHKMVQLLLSLHLHWCLPQVLLIAKRTQQGVKWELTHCSVNFHLVINDVERIFIYLLTFICHSWKNISSRFLPIFKTDNVNTLLLSYVRCITSYLLQIFSLVQRLCFPFVGYFLCFLVWYSSTFFVCLLLLLQLLVEYPRKHCQDQYQVAFLPCFF